MLKQTDILSKRIKVLRHLATCGSHVAAMGSNAGYCTGLCLVCIVMYGIAVYFVVLRYVLKCDVL